jgi:PAS domain S-box-containing protein
MFGYTCAEAFGRHGTEWMVPEDRERVKNNMVSGYEEPYQVTALRKNGTTFPCEIQGKRITYRGRPIRITALSDITDRRRAEKELLKSEERYRRIFENLQDVYYEDGIDGTILEVSPSIEKFSLYKRKELIGKSLFDIYTDPNERDEFIKLILDKGMVNDYEINLKDKDGSQHPCSITTLLMRDSQGTPVRLIGSMRDISERKRAEEALLESKERYRQLFNNESDAVMIFDATSKQIEDANPATLNLFEYTKDEFL